MHRSLGVWSDSTPQFGEPICTSLPAAEGVESLHTPANGLICPHLRQAKKKPPAMQVASAGRGTSPGRIASETISSAVHPSR